MTTAFPLVQHKISLTAGKVSGTIVHCEADGTIDVLFTDGSKASAYAMKSGEDRSLGPTVEGIEIKSGTFSVA